MANEGIAKGLAYRHDFGSSINNLYRQEKMYAEQRMEKERKSKYYAELLAKPPLASPGATKQLETFADKKIKEASDYAIANPDFERDPEKFAKFRSIADSIVNNDIVRKDQQVQQSFAALQQDLQNGLIDEEDVEAEMKAYEKYQQDETGTEDYFYTRPKRIDMLDVIKDGVSITGSMVQDIPGPDGSMIRATATKKNRDAAALTILNDKKKRKEVERNWIADGAKENGFTLQEYLSERIKLAMNIQEIQSVRGGSGSGGSGGVDYTYDRSSQFGMHVEDPVLEAMQNAYTGKVIDEADENIVFTGREFNKVYQFSAADEIRYINTDEDGNVSYGKTFGKKGIHSKITSSGSIVTVSGMPYVEGNVTIQFDKERKLEDSFKTDGGFEIVEGFTDGFNINISGLDGSEKKDMVTMSGKVLLPANFDRKNILAYDAEYYGQDAMKDLGSIENYPAYQNAANQIKSSQELNQRALTFEDQYQDRIIQPFEPVGDEGWRRTWLNDGREVLMNPKGEFILDGELPTPTNELGPSAPQN
mgnify:CR=1 FL=1